MSLTPRETALVRSSIPILRSRGEIITRVFYESLLDAQPDLHNIFNSANQANGRQPRALLSVILAFAAAPNHLSELSPRLERVCNKHCSLGVEPQQYDIVGEYLLRAFGEVLGPEWTPALEGAWVKSYALLSRVLSGRESQLYREFGEWKEWKFLRIEHKVIEADDVYSFYLVRPDGVPLPRFVPGQYISVRVEVPSIGYLQSRQYSLSDGPQRDYYRITVRRNTGATQIKGDEVTHTGPGLVSNILIDKYDIGDCISVSHPAGGFGFEKETTGTSPLVMISAGSGATPLMSMFDCVVHGPDGSTRPVSWIHCSPPPLSRTVPFEEHIRTTASAKGRKNVTARFLHGQFADEDDGRDCAARGESLRIELKRLGRDVLHLDHGAAGYYICGPKTFTQDVGRFLSMKGVDTERIHREWFATGDLELMQ